MGGVDGLDGREIRGGRDSDGPDLRDELIGGRFTGLASSVPTSESGSGSDEVMDERVGGGNEYGESPLRGHRDEARLVSEIDPAAPNSDGEGGPVKLDEYLYGLVCRAKESDLNRAWCFLCFRGREGG